METPVSASERGSSDGESMGGSSSVLLLYARTPVEEEVLHGWAAEQRRASGIAVHAGRGELADRIAGAERDPRVVPVRVAWLPRERDGDRRVRLRDVVALNDPRRPRSGAQEK